MLPFFCMVDRRKTLHRQVTSSTNELRTPILTTEIPYSSIVEQMGIRRAPVAAFAPSSNAARAYDRLWEEIQERSGL